MTQPPSLAAVYRELPYYDLPYAEREVGKIVVIGYPKAVG